MAFFGRATAAVGERLGLSFYAARLRPSRSTHFGSTRLAAKEKSDVVAHPARIP